MQDKVLISHPIIGKITLKDLLNDLEIMLSDNIFLEDIVYNLLKDTSMSEEDISSLFNYSISERLKWIIFVLKNII